MRPPITGLSTNIVNTYKLFTVEQPRLCFTRSQGKKKKMRKFDPWPVFFRREWNRNWPFLVGFAITGAIITKFSLGLTEEDAKNSPFVQRHRKYASKP
ncbi:hypothetical protein Pint_06257 [Pistacia integerrima]|uniref:Uncharacterized protein n=2 Tax=Pistacia TaxID=55512 RepID=A0ACC0Z839_9ROSI|nr:hypothetical protein Pint_06257 [Pistacia integerrima]